MAVVALLAACTRSTETTAERKADVRGVQSSKLRPVMPNIPIGPPLVGEEGIDDHGYPLRRPDRIVLKTMLQLDRFDELTRWMTYYQDEFEADHKKEFWADDALRAFTEGDETLGPRLDAWIDHTPDHFAPWAARGAWRMGMAWKARGGKPANETSPEQFAAMNEHLAAAEPDLQRALKLRPKLIAAAQRLMDIERTQGRRDRARARLDAALEQCPQCVRIRLAHAIGLQPRWGGSYEQLEAFAREVQPLLSQNPLLGAIGGHAAYDRCKTLAERKAWDQAEAACDEAIRAGALPLYLCMRGRVSNWAKKYEQALPHFDRALRMSPQEHDCLVARYVARKNTLDTLGAAKDLVTARQLDPADDFTTKSAEWMVQKLRFDAQELRKAGHTDDAAALLDIAVMLAPDDGDLAARRTWNEANADIDELAARAAGAPKDFDVRRRLDHALATKRRFPDIVQMWDAYIETRPDDSRAYRERSGARWQLGDQAGALADMQRACDLGNAEACRDVPRMKARARP